jgi:O-antigen/teichoic acid export membrane protein
VSSVGLYSFGYQIAGLINLLFVLPLAKALLPITFRQEADPEGQKDFLRITCTYFYLAGMFVCLFLSLYCKEIIELIARKEEFWSSWIVVPVVAYSYVLSGLGGFFDWGLVMTKNGLRISINVIAGAIVNISLNFVLIPKWGIIGAACATLISIVMLNGLRLYYSAKYFGLHFDLMRLLHITIAGGGLYAISQAVGSFDSLSSDLLVKFFIFLSLFPIIFFTGFFSTKEKENMHKLWDSIRKNGFRKTYSKISSLF